MPGFVIEMSVAHVPSVAGGTGSMWPAPGIIRAWKRDAVTVIRICVEVTPAVAVPPPVTVRVTVLEPGVPKACCTVRPVSVGPPFTAHENVAAVSGSVAVKPMARPASASQFPLNWFWVAPVSV